MARYTAPMVETGVFAPQSSAKHRAPAPKLSREHLSIARSAPVSDTEALSAGFLTPPASGPRSMSPPPRDNAEDYVNVPRHRNRRRHAGKQARQHHSLVDDPGISTHGPRSPTSTIRSNGGRCESCEASSKASDSESVSDIVLPKKTKQLKLNTNISSNPRIAAEFTQTPMPAWAMLNQPIRDTRDVESPAVNALRSLSQPLTPNTESQTLRRMSTALASALAFLRPSKAPADPAEYSTEERGLPEALERCTHPNGLPELDASIGRTISKKSRAVIGTLGKPATITLRKASNVIEPSPVTSSMAASTIDEHDYKPNPDTSKSELLAFYSTPLTVLGNSEINNRPAPASVNAPASVQLEASSDAHLPSSSERKTSLSVAPLNDIDRWSFPAETTLTFTDVHTAPGSFTIEPRSRKASLVPSESCWRISTVHFRSRNSVHEVIWREDETTSGSSFASNSSSPPHQETLPQLPTPCTRCQNIPAAVKDGSDSSPRRRSFLLNSYSKSEENLFQWSWDVPSSSTKFTNLTTALTDVAAVEILPPGSSDPAYAKRRKSSAPISTRPSHSAVRVQSLTPLRDAARRLNGEKQVL